MATVTQNAPPSVAPPSGQLAHKIALSSGLNIGKQIIVLAGSVVVARVVGPQVLGIVAYAVAFVGLFASLSDLGFGSAHVKRVSEGWDVGQCMGMMWLAKAVALATMTVTVVLALVFGGGSSFPTFEQATVLWLSLGTAIVG